MALREVEPEDLDRLDQVDALRAVGDVHRTVEVVHEDPDDFTKAQRHDGEVVTAQLQHRRAQQNAEQRRQPGTQRDHPPDDEVQPVREQVVDPLELVGQVRRTQQRHHVGAHRVERDVTQIEQAGKAHHDVQAQGQHDVQQCEVQHAHPVVATCGAHDERREDRKDQEAVQRGARLHRRFEIFCHGAPLLMRGPQRVRP